MQITSFSSTPFRFCRYLHLRSNSKVVVNRTNFDTFFALPNFKGAVLPKVVLALTPPPRDTSSAKVSSGYSIDHCAKFQASQPTHLWDLMLGKKIKKTSCVKHKSFRKLLFSGGLKIQNGAVWHKNQNWREHAQGMSNQRYSFQLKRSKIKVSSSWDINSLPKGTLGSALC